MSAVIEADDALLAEARELVAALESGDGGRADELLEALCRRREQGLFQELGRMTRQLHEALNGFALDTRVASLAESDIPDARMRLNHVIDMTENAANRTLTAVEGTLPIAEQLRAQADDLADKWRRFCNKDMKLDEFRAMSREIADFLTLAHQHADRIHGNLSEVMMAQDFQDLTGQIIRRVISLVQEVEDRLIELVRLSGNAARKDEQPDARSGLARGQGPAVPGVKDDGNAVSGQDEVDDLLSSLGF